MCCTAAGWLGPVFPPPADLRTEGPLVLDMTAAAAAPETQAQILHYYSRLQFMSSKQTHQIILLHHKGDECHL